ncbi:MAG: YraN family protein [Pseudomonadaceae bacterium]|nr:YraN family protein [Pseudomonadaceae bacterium]
MRGRRAERAASRHIQLRGATILQRNYACRVGEIDLIARHRGYLVFVEVRMRNAGARVSAEASVDARKQRRIIRTAEHFLARGLIRQDLPCRFDVISVRKTHYLHRCTWIQGAFTA